MHWFNCQAILVKVKWSWSIGQLQSTTKHPYLVFMKRATKRTGPVLAFARVGHVTLWITEPALFWQWINLLTNSQQQAACFCSLFWPYYYIWLWSNVWWQNRRQHKKHISFYYIPSLNVFSVHFRVSLVFHHQNWQFASRKAGNTSEKWPNTEKTKNLGLWCTKKRQKAWCLTFYRVQ